MSADAYPLNWPPGWPRHKGERDSDTRFKGPTYRWDRVFGGLVDELRRIGAKNIVVSTNQPVRKDGYPYAQERSIPDVGVAVYFTRNGKSLVMAQDRFWTVLGNMRSLTMAIEGLRQMERHGGATMLERAFDGFTALPAPDDCWTVLGVDGRRETVTVEVIRRHFKARAAELLDHRGMPTDMGALVRARDEALEKFK